MPQPLDNITDIKQPAYRALTADTAAVYLATIPALAAQIGGAPEMWQVREVGDGNLNLVFIMKGAAATIIAKQALPYVRMVGDSWPLPLSRAHYEYAALVEQTKYAPDLVPKLYYHDHDMALTVMEYLSPHIILRKGLIQGIYYPNLARDVGTFLAHTLFGTSDMNLPAADKKQLMAQFCGNTAMCKISEDLIFTEPFYDAPMNRHTSPALDKMVAIIRDDTVVKYKAQSLKYAFLTRAEALLHGDLHTGSIMATESDTRVIDPEFAFFGPMGFDVGAIIANLLMAYYAHSAHQRDFEKRVEYQEWLLTQILYIWEHFEYQFTQLWQQRALEKPGGDAFSTILESADPQLQRDAIKSRLFTIWHDAVGFAALKMIRRIVGLSHVEDFESIADPEVRGSCERRALWLAREMLHRPDALTIKGLTGAARIYNEH